MTDLESARIIDRLMVVICRERHGEADHEEAVDAMTEAVDYLRRAVKEGIGIQPETFRVARGKGLLV